MPTIKFSPEMTSFAETVSALGGKAFLVGGAVRDAQMNRSVHDFDFVVTGVSEKKFSEGFGNPRRTGNSFPVFRLQMGSNECEVALARTERKVGTGHNGFEMTFDPSVTIEEDLLRRDLTINAMAVEVLSGTLIDPFGGAKDVEKGTLRAVSHHFMEDPLRVLRVARMAAVFGFEPSTETLSLMKECVQELPALPHSRVWGEMQKALQATHPSTFFRVLRASGTLDAVCPELGALVGQTQPEQHHPEGDAFEHSMLVLDKVAGMTEDLTARFCALFHDVGKGLTPKEELPKHFNHDVKGHDLIMGWVDGRFPARLKKAAAIVARHHMQAMNLNNMKPGTVLRMLEAVKRELEVFRIVVEADSGMQFAVLQDDFVEAVFAKIAIPMKLIEFGDGQKIAGFVRQEHTRRIRELLR